MPLDEINSFGLVMMLAIVISCWLSVVRAGSESAIIPMIEERTGNGRLR
jgi:hypothetical protein